MLCSVALSSGGGKTNTPPSTLVEGEAAEMFFPN